MTEKKTSGHGGRRPGAGAPRGNFNAFKHGLCSEQYPIKLELASRAHRQKVLAHMRDLVRAYHSGILSRTQRANLVQQAGLTVLTSWYGLCDAISAEQSRW